MDLAGTPASTGEGIIVASSETTLPGGLVPPEAKLGR